MFLPFKTSVLQHFNNILASEKEITSETLKNLILGILNEKERPKTFSEMAQLMNREFSKKAKIKKCPQNTLNKHTFTQNFHFQYLKDLLLSFSKISAFFRLEVSKVLPSVNTIINGSPFEYSFM